MKQINITCETCHITHEVDRTSEIPKNAISMKCNWCPNCEDKATDYYEEWYNTSEGGDKQPDPIPDNQLCFPFTIDEMIDKHAVKHIIKTLDVLYNILCFVCLPYL